MKKIFIITTLLLLVNFALSQTNEWLLSAGGKHSDCGSALAIDSEGNIYLVGSFQGEAQFGDQTLYSRGDTDIFLAKYTQEGKLNWIKQAGSYVTKRNTITEYPTAIALDEQAIYVTGVFARIADFSGQKITSKGKEDIFLAKYDLEGSLIWIKRAGGNSQDVPNALALDKDGNIYITGYFQKLADFESKQITSSNQRESFIAKYSPKGELLWLNSSNSMFYSQGKSLSIDKDGVLLAGEFAREMIVSNQNLQSNGSTDLFIVKYDFDGNSKWVRSFGSDGIDIINDIKVADDDIYLVGSYLTNSKNNFWESKGARDGFVSKLSSNGDLIWNKTLGGSENDDAIAVDINNNNLLVTGKFGAEFEYEDEVYLSNGFTDIFLVKMDLNGAYQDIKMIGGSGQDFPTSIAIRDNQIHMTGLFRDNLTTTTSASGSSDIFLSSQSLNLNHDNETKVTYLVYPNPTESDFWIRSEKSFNTIELIAKDGRRLEFKEGLNTYEYLFELSKLPSGIYYVRIDGFSVKKLIIL